MALSAISSAHAAATSTISCGTAGQDFDFCNVVSAALWNATHDVLSGTVKAEEAVKRLDAKIDSIRRGPNG